MILPRTYEDPHGKYPQHKGKAKLSYSQYTSWKDEQYQPQYIVQYFSGIKLPDGIWAEYGKNVGEFIEHYAQKLKHPEYTMLSDEDKEFLRTLDYPENCTYEDEIVFDCGAFVVQGFTDRTELFECNSVGTRDYKTGNLLKKKEFYASDEYGQTTLYCHQKVKEGHAIKYSEVMLLGRKGNNMTIKGKFHPIRLSGEKEIIPTEYSEERAEALIEDIKKTAKEIEYCFKTYLKYFGSSK